MNSFTPSFYEHNAWTPSPNSSTDDFGGQNPEVGDAGKPQVSHRFGQRSQLPHLLQSRPRHPQTRQRDRCHVGTAERERWGGTACVGDGASQGSQRFGAFEQEDTCLKHSEGSRQGSRQRTFAKGRYKELR